MKPYIRSSFEKVTAFTVKAGYEISNTKLDNSIMCKYMKRFGSQESLYILFNLLW